MTRAASIRSTATAAALVALVASAGRASAGLPPAPDAETARALLELPSGTVSLRTVHDGSLEHGETLPFEGDSWAVFPQFRQRNSNWGTSELIGLIRRASATVAAAYPGSVLGVGNLSPRGGGRIGQSVSHRSGRDADIGFYALDAHGRHHDPMAFLAYGEDLLTKDARHYRYDLERNLALVEAMLQDPVTRIQWIFVADWLKRPLIALAREKGHSPELVAQLEEVLHQPSDSNPHHHHFHVRIYCSIEDRLHGCLDTEPLHPWVDLGDEAWEKRIDALLGILATPRRALRIKAMAALAAIRAHRTVGAIASFLESDDERLREGAAEALAELRNPAMAPALIATLRRTEDPEWALRLVRLMYQADLPEMAPIAVTLLRDPQLLLTEEVRRAGLAPIHEIVADLLGVHGRVAAAHALVPLLGSSDSDVRRKAHEALNRITNMDFQVNMAHADQRLQDAQVRRWRNFLAVHPDGPWREWLRLGFEARGIALDPELRTPETIEALLEQLGDRRPIRAENAARLLGEIAGEPFDPRQRTPRNNMRWWRSWWALNKSTWNGAPPTPTP